MNTELFDQLEQKISQAVDTIDMLQLEVDELRQDNQRLTEERQQWESRLNRIVAQLSRLDNTPAIDTAASGSETSSPAASSTR